MVYVGKKIYHFNDRILIKDLIFCIHSTVDGVLPFQQMIYLEIQRIDYHSASEVLNIYTAIGVSLDDCMEARSPNSKEP